MGGASVDRRPIASKRPPPLPLKKVTRLVGGQAGKLNVSSVRTVESGTSLPELGGESGFRTWIVRLIKGLRTI